MMFKRKIQFRGVTLLELLISVAIGAMIIIFISSIYVIAKKNRNEQLALITILENARAAILILKQTLPYAGFTLCHPSSVEPGMIGDDNSITVKYATKRSALILKQESPTVIWTSAKPPFYPNDRVVISDCQHTEFTNIGTSLLYHDRQKLTFTSGLKNTYLVAHEISRFNQNTFFVHPTTRKNKFGQSLSALYVKNFHHKQIELVEGIDAITFHYDVLKEGRLISVSAKNVSDWTAVKGVAVDLTLSSTEGTPLQKEWHTYIALREV